MGLYLLQNFRTVPFKEQSYDGQPERFIRADVIHRISGQLIAVIPLFGSFYLDAVKKYEMSKEPLPEEIMQPIYGEFVEVKQADLLYRRYTLEDVQMQLCFPSQRGEIVRNSKGQIQTFDAIKFFTHYSYDSDTGKKYTLLNGNRQKEQSGIISTVMAE